MAISEKIIETRQKALALCKEYFARPDEIAEFKLEHDELKQEKLRKDEVGELHIAMGKIVNNFKQIINQVNTSSKSIAEISSTLDQNSLTCELMANEVDKAI